MDATSTIPATFKKKYQGGILTSCTVDNPGQKYSETSYSNNFIDMYDLVPNQYNGVYIDPSSGIPLDRTDTLVQGNVDALNQSATELHLTQFTSSEAAALTANMSDDTTFNEYLFYLKAASKTPVRRFMEVQLSLVNS